MSETDAHICELDLHLVSSQEVTREEAAELAKQHPQFIDVDELTLKRFDEREQFDPDVPIF